MYKVSKRTCTAIVLLIKPFVWRRSRCRRRRGLLKLPIVLVHHTLADKARQDVLRSSAVRYRPTSPILLQICLNSPHTSRQVKIFCRPTKNRLVCGGLKEANCAERYSLPANKRLFGFKPLLVKLPRCSYRK